MTSIITEIEDITGPRGVIKGNEVRTRSGDWQGRTPCNAKAIIRPASTEELSQILRLCNEKKQTVIPVGGLTGLVHGTDANDDDLLLSLERMNVIEGIDPVGATINVQAGAPLQAVQDAARKHKLLYPVDLGARGSCTIGGNIATNAGGNQVLRYGMTREQVLGLEAVMADGTIMTSMNSLIKNNTGYDLKQLFIGAEGTLGIVTRAVLRLQPLPSDSNTALLAFSNFENLTQFFCLAKQYLMASLTSFEVMWREHYQIVAVDSGNHTPPLPAGSMIYALIESTDTEAAKSGEVFNSLLEQAFERDLIEDAVVSQSLSQREALWAIREDIECLANTLLPGGVFDISLPIVEMEDYVFNLKQAVTHRWGEQAKVVIFGHLGDGNLHVVISPGEWSNEFQQEAEELVYKPLQSMGGSISAEHGIGIEKRENLSRTRAPQEINMMRQLKAVFDPKGILNPGKIFEFE